MRTSDLTLVIPIFSLLTSRSSTSVSCRTRTSCSRCRLPPTPSAPLLSVAKHYLTDRASFNETARYWAQAYAGAEGGPGSKAKKGSIALAGLDPIAVDRFIAMGFPEEQVVSSPKSGNCAGDGKVSEVADIPGFMCLARLTR